MLWYFYPYDHPDVFNSTSKSHFDTAAILPAPALHPNDSAPPSSNGCHILNFSLHAVKLDSGYGDACGSP